MKCPKTLNATNSLEHFYATIADVDYVALTFQINLRAAQTMYRS